MLTKSVILHLIGITFGQFPVKPDLKSCKTTQLANANRRFAYDLFRQTALTTAPDANVVVAPLVVSMGLSMVMEGAKGTTREELETVLNYKEAQIDEYDNVACVYAKYNTESQPTLRTAARLYGEKSIEFSDDFLLKTSQYVGNKLGLVDFLGAPEASRKIINSWVAEETSGHISQLFPDGSIDSSTRIAIASVLYFKGDWETPFKTTNTVGFYKNETNVVQAPFMEDFISAKMIFHRETRLTFLQLPYKAKKGGPAVSMILVLDPVTYNVTDIEARLTSSAFDDAIKALKETHERNVLVAMPRFTMNVEYDLVGRLRAMGLSRLFSEGLSDLSGMNGEGNLFVAQAQQKTFISVDQKGTEAAGAFGVGITALSLPEAAVFDKPFHFLIYETKTDNVLFIGRVSDPTEG